MRYVIHPKIGEKVEMNSGAYSFRFFHTLDLILPGAKIEIDEDCLVPVEIEVLWNNLVEDKGEIVKREWGYNFDASLRLWNMELLDGKDDIEKLQCGADYLLRDTKMRFYVYKDREGLGTLFYRNEYADYINQNFVEQMHKEAMEDYRELFETPYYEFDDKNFEIKMT